MPIRLYDFRCRCNEEFGIIKKPKLLSHSKGKPLQYPVKIRSKTFQFKYEKKLSFIAKFILNSFRNKYIYYAIDDIIYLLNSNPVERDNLLSILYSPLLSLQNSFYINFFDIWIHEIYIEEISKLNKFLKQDCQTLRQFTYITIKFFYQTRVPVKRQESLW